MIDHGTFRILGSLSIRDPDTDTTLVRHEDIHPLSHPIPVAIIGDRDHYDDYQDLWQHTIIKNEKK